MLPRSQHGLASPAPAVDSPTGTLCSESLRTAVCPENEKALLPASMGFIWFLELMPGRLSSQFLDSAARPEG